MKNLQNDIRNAKLTKQAILKSDLDIETIKSLNKLADDTGNILVLSGGYAVEASCGGEITRAHGDVDAHLILTGTATNEDLLLKVQAILDKENTKWVLKQKTPEKLDYLEDDENKEFFNKRHVEVRLNAPHENNIKYPKYKLINSKGETVGVIAVDLNQMISEKINKIFETKDHVDTSIDRHPSVTDYNDLKRLLLSDGFDKTKVLKTTKEDVFNLVMKILE